MKVKKEIYNFKIDFEKRAIVFKVSMQDILTLAYRLKDLTGYGDTKDLFLRLKELWEKNDPQKIFSCLPFRQWDQHQEKLKLNREKREATKKKKKEKK